MTNGLTKRVKKALGVELNGFTVVGARAVVTRSFSVGYCVLAGNPARLLR
jgi:acetyltransferase-like isoleucine patch superfamily enzyme